MSPPPPPVWARPEPVVVVGSACRFAGGATSPAKLWELLKTPRDLHQVVPDSRFSTTGFYHADNLYHGHANVRHAYLLEDDPRAFDAHFFGIKPVEAEAMDPQQRFLLEIVFEALEAAGIPMARLQDSDTAVYVGSMFDDYGALLLRDLQEIPTYYATGTSRSVLANRISYFYNWHGPSVSVDTACSSSLVAIHLAVQALRSGETKAALACGTNLILGPESFIVESKLKMLSPDGLGRMWDQNANGYARGEGVAAVVLKTLSAALADGDHIECVIRETGLNTDGATAGGLTMPSATAQEALIRATYARAGLDVSVPGEQPQYFEAHGTGTPAGDPREAEAIHRALASSRGQAAVPLYVGSIKTVLGHTEGTAGLAAVLKASLALQNGCIPPNMLLSQLSDQVAPFYQNVQIPLATTPWPEGCLVRRASVNSFGFGGANAHAILESLDSRLRPSIQATDSDDGPLFVPFVFSAASKSSLQRKLARYSTFLAGEGASLDPQNLAWVLRTRLSLLPWRTCFVASSVEDLRNQLSAELGKEASPPGVQAFPAGRGHVIGIFTGQGAQYPRMAAELIEQSTFANNIIQTLESYLAELPPDCRPSWSLRSEILAAASSSRVQEAALSQPLCTAIQILLLDILQHTGVRLDIVVGHSSGEIAAAYAAGYLSARDALYVAYFRGLHAKHAGSGAMLAVSTTAEDASELCADRQFAGRIVVAAVNSSNSVTIAGEESAIAELELILDDEDKSHRRLRVDKAYHSPQMLPCAAPYVAALSRCGITPQTPEAHRPVWCSSVYDKPTEPDFAALQGTYWAANLTRPVLFQQALERAVKARSSSHLFLEIGAHAALKGPAMQTIQEVLGKTTPYSGLLTRGQNAVKASSAALGYLWSHLGAVDLEQYHRAVAATQHESTFSMIKGLPTYPWDHTAQYWHESRRSRKVRLRKHPVHLLLGDASPHDTRHRMSWRNLLRVSELKWLQGHKVEGQVVFPMSGYVATALEAATVLAADLGERARLIELRDFLVHQATVIENERGVETLVSLSSITRQSADKIFAKFTYDAALGSDDGLELTQVASCDVEIALGEPDASLLPQRKPATPHMIDVEPERFYASLDSLGYNFSESFRSLVTLQRRNGRASCAVSASVVDNSRDTPPLLVHPVYLDGAIQSIIAAHSYPYDERLRVLHLPTSIKRIRVNPALCRKNDSFAVEAYIVPRANDQHGVVGQVEVFSPDAPYAMIQIEKAAFKPLSDAKIEDDRRVFSKVCWINSQPDGLEAASSIEPAPGHSDTIRVLERIASFYLRKLEREVPQDHPSRSQFPTNRYLNFAAHITSLTEAGRLKWAEASWLDDRFQDIRAASAPYSHLPDVEIMHLVGSNMSAMIHQGKSMLEAFRGDGNDILDRYYAKGFGLTETARWVARSVMQIADRHPHMNILEIGAGTGGATKAILGETGGRFASYTYTDISAAFFQTAAATFSQYGNRMVFKTLDAEQDPVAQGFQAGEYDLVVAFFVIHATSDLAACLQHMRTLLRPGGFLVVAEGFEDGRYDVASNGFIFGTLPGWWLGAEQDRLLSPHATPEHWNKLLQATGFSAVISTPPDSFVSEFNSYPFVAQALNPQMEFLRAPLATSSWDAPRIQNLAVIGGRSEHSARLVRGIRETFQQSQLATSIHVFDDLLSVDYSVLDPSSTVISLSELDKPVFKNITQEAFQSLKTMFGSPKTLLWVTSGRLADEPFSNMTVGFGRCAANETPGLRLQQLDIASPTATSPETIVDILLRFQFSTLEAQHGLLWSVEPEILIDSSHRQLLARQRPIPELNDRYNSASRTIEYMQDIHDRPLVLRHGVGGYFLRQLHETSQAKPPQKDVMDVQVMQSTMFAVRTSVGHKFVAICVDAETGKRYLVLVSPLTSKMTLASESAALIPEDQLFDDVPICALLQIISAHLVAMSTLDSLFGGQTIMLHNAPQVVAAAFIQQAQAKGVHVVQTADSSRHKEAPAAPQGCIILPRNASRYDLEEVLRLYTPAAFVGFSSSKGQHAAQSLENEATVIDILGQSAETCPSIVTADALFQPSGSKVQVPPAIVGDAVRKALAFAKEALLQDTDAHLSAQDAVTRLESLVDHSASSSSSSSSSSPPTDDALALVDWTTATPAPVRVARLDTTPMFAGTGSTYWVVGMTGALGLSLVDWMVDKGARYIVMTSRHPDVSPEWVAAHARRNATVVVLACDVGDEASLQDIHERIRATLPPVAGVINGAMVLRDVSVHNMSLDQLTDVLKPKVDGSIYLDRIFWETPLDFFVLISSINCVIGNWGQANYAAANTFMCSLAANRRKRGFRAAAVNGGAIVGAGYMERESRRALDQIVEKLHMMRLSEDDWCMSICEAIEASRLDSPHGPEISTGVSDVPFDIPNAPLWYSNPKFSAFIVGQNTVHEQERNDAGLPSVSVADLLRACKTRQDVFNVIQEAFAAQLRSQLRVDTSDQDLMAARGHQIGLDSLVSVDVASWFRKELQVAMPVLKIMSNEVMASLVEEAAEQVPLELLPSLEQQAEETSLAPDAKQDGDRANATVVARSSRKANGESLMDWESESRLPPDLEPLLKQQTVRNPVRAQPRVVVLTGVTGLLGRHLLHHLLAQPTVEKVICLATRDLTSRLKAAELAHHGERVTYYEGELSQPLLGLDEKTAASIFAEADAVIHNGADTSHMKAYPDLKASNVGSTTTLLRLCLPRRIPFHYISSAGLAVLYAMREAEKTAGSNNDKVNGNGTSSSSSSGGGGGGGGGAVGFPPISVATMPPPAGLESFGYLCSKWVSERLLERSAESTQEPTMRVFIHRPSTILREKGTRDSLERRAGLDWVNALLQYVQILRAVPLVENNIDGALDLVRPESVCRGILQHLCEPGDGARPTPPVHYVHEVGDVVIPLKGMEHCAYLRAESRTEDTADEEETNIFDVVPLQQWITKAVDAGIHPAVAELIQAMDSGSTMSYPILLKEHGSTGECYPHA